MKHMRFFLAMILCLSLLAFAGCGNETYPADDADNGTVNEQTTETNNNDSSTDDSNLNGGNGKTGSGSDKTNDTGNNGNSDGNVVDGSENSEDSGARSLGEAAEDMKNDMKDAVDGRDRTDGNTKNN